MIFFLDENLKKFFNKLDKIEYNFSFFNTFYKPLDKEKYEKINKLCNYKNNYNYSIQSIVEDYNQRWNENITVQDYLKTFTRRHRGAC